MSDIAFSPAGGRAGGHYQSFTFTFISMKTYTIAIPSYKSVIQARSEKEALEQFGKITTLQ
jgi:hypothetical protein